LAGNFFIGIGPILLGTALIYILLFLLLGLNPFNFVTNVDLAMPHIYSWGILTTTIQTFWSSSTGLISEIFSGNNLSTWQLYVFIYLAFAIGSSITLSPSDIKGTLKGLSVILILVFIFNLATVWAGDLTSNIFKGTISYFLVFYISMFLILLMDIFVSFVLLLPLSLMTRHSKR
jgi:hypothetical protein